MHDIFISYSHSDLPIAIDLARKLTVGGYSVFFDRELKPGDLWKNVVQREIRSCRAVIALISPESQNSDWVMKELTIREHLNKDSALIPVTLGCSLEEIRAFVREEVREHQSYALSRNPASAELDNFVSVVQTVLRLPRPHPFQEVSRLLKELADQGRELFIKGDFTAARAVYRDMLRFKPGDKKINGAIRDCIEKLIDLHPLRLVGFEAIADLTSLRQALKKNSGFQEAFFTQPEVEPWVRTVFGDTIAYRAASRDARTAHERTSLFLSQISS